MMKKLLFTLLCLVCIFINAQAQTVINTSFEASPANPAFTVGNVNSQNSFTVSNGSVEISNSQAKTGTNSLRLFTTTSGALLANYIPYSGTVSGISTDFYTDFWVKPIAYTTKGLTINAFDLFGGSAKRIFVIEFTTDNKIRTAPNGTSVDIGTWTANTWVRVSVKVDFSTEKYKVAINGTVNVTDFAFRETYTAAARFSGATARKEFHSLRFNHNSDSQAAISNTYIDDLYIGTAAISDVSFGVSSTVRTITVNQPDYGSIALSPVQTTYNVGDEITATLTLPAGYTNNGWTGSLSGTELTKTFTVANSVTIGADVIVDVLNPPAQFTVNVTQPTNGVITLTPSSLNNLYYEGAKVTATIAYENCYQFNNWTGDLSGNSINNQFTISGNVNIGASISENTTPAIQRVVSNASQFLAALDAMNPGDEIIVENGNYTLGSKTIRRSGCASKPILIRARNQGMAVLTGNTSLVLESLNNVTIQGFSIQSANVSTGIKIQNSNRIRITRNSFALTESSSCNWIYIGDTFGSTDPLKSGNNKIDYNEFNGKTQSGKYIVLDGTATQQSQRDSIMYNVFRNNGPRAANEKESIRVGWSNISKSSGYTVLMYNLFEDCDGDPEIVSIKSSDNMIKYNTFRRCLGTLSLRHGDRNIVEGNYFFGEGKTAVYDGGTIGCGGVRVYGKDHQIINNYFEGLTGSKWDATITITNGDVINTSTSLSSHYLPENILVAFNTLVNNESDIEIGFTNNNNYNKAPINCTIANNIVIQNVNPIVKSFSSTSLAGVNFSNNIFYPTGTSSVGISYGAGEIIVTDPKLIKPSCVGVDCELSMAAKVRRLAADSPAIDASVGTYPSVTADFENNTRTGVKDIGAHEFNSDQTVTVSALNLVNAGTNITPLSYSYNYNGILPIKLLSFEGQAELSNIKLTWKVNNQINVDSYELEWRDDKQEFVKITTITPYTFNSSLLIYDYLHKNAFDGNNYYRLKVMDKDGTYEYTAVINVKKAYSATIYPNPAKGILNINLSSDIPNGATWSISNSLGVVVFVQKATENKQQQIPLTNINAGMYYLQLYKGNQIFFVKPLLVN